jgi:hypothetical protein
MRISVFITTIRSQTLPTNPRGGNTSNLFLSQEKKFTGQYLGAKILSEILANQIQ